MQKTTDGHPGSDEQFADWLSDDLETIDDVRAIALLPPLIERVRSRLSGADQVPRWLLPLEAGLERIHAAADEKARLRHLNETLRTVFVSTLLTTEDSSVSPAGIESRHTVKYRLASREPLPTMDFMTLLATDEREPSPLQRAAVLTSSLLKLHASRSRMLGTTLVPGETVDRLVDSDDGDLRILVLVDGGIHVVRLGSDPSAHSPQQIHRLLQQIEVRPRHPASDPWTGALPALLTAASRPTCYRVRALLEQKPQHAQALADIDGCAFAVCLDVPGSPGSSSRAPRTSPHGFESTCRRLFGNAANRWFGMTCLVVDAQSQAALIFSYMRGMEALPAIRFATTLFDEAAIQTLPTESAPSPADAALSPSSSVARLEFAGVQLEALGRTAAAEIEKVFHQQTAFHSIEIGSEFLKSIDVSPNAAVQYLLMLAARAVHPDRTGPAATHAVNRQHDVLDWPIVSAAGLKDLSACMAQPEKDAEFLAGFRDLVQRHAEKVKRTQQSGSPSGHLRGPTSEADELLYDFFMALGLAQASGYRSYLFRAARRPRSMDIITSAVKLPPSVQYLGRPGATCWAAELFGLHMVIGPQRTDLFFIPNPSRTSEIKAFHRSLASCVEHLKRATDAVARRITGPLEI